MKTLPPSHFKIVNQSIQSFDNLGWDVPEIVEVIKTFNNYSETESDNSGRTVLESLLGYINNDVVLSFVLPAYFEMKPEIKDADLAFRTIRDSLEHPENITNMILEKAEKLLDEKFWASHATSLLQTAIYRKANNALIELFLQKGGNPNCETKIEFYLGHVEKRPLPLIMCAHSIKTFELLLKYGADTSPRSHGKNVLAMFEERKKYAPHSFTEDPNTVVKGVLAVMQNQMKNLSPELKKAKNQKLLWETIISAKGWMEIQKLLTIMGDDVRDFRGDLGENIVHLVAGKNPIFLKNMMNSKIVKGSNLLTGKDNFGCGLAHYLLSKDTPIVGTEDKVKDLNWSTIGEANPPKTEKELVVWIQPWLDKLLAEDEYLNVRRDNRNSYENFFNLNQCSRFFDFNFGSHLEQENQIFREAIKGKESKLLESCSKRLFLPVVEAKTPISDFVYDKDSANLYCVKIFHDFSMSMRGWVSDKEKVVRNFNARLDEIKGCPIGIEVLAYLKGESKSYVSEDISLGLEAAKLNKTKIFVEAFEGAVNQIERTLLAKSTTFDSTVKRKVL